MICLKPHGLVRWLVACLALAGPAHAATTPSGHVYTPPDTFAVSSTGRVATFTAPEGDAWLMVVDLARAGDADDAVTQAWQLARPDFRRRLLSASARPDRNGWQDQKAFLYETSPAEKMLVQALARRAGQDGNWVVVLMEGAVATLEKRAAPISSFMSGLLPKGQHRESFAGRAARPLTAQRVEQLKAFVADGMQQLGVPGAGLSFVQGGKVVWAGGLGVRDMGRPETVDADTLFAAASNTKAMTTALQAVAVDAGRLRWEQRAADALPAFRLADPALTAQVQVRHLACACTGMPRQDLELMWADPLTPARYTFTRLAEGRPTSRFGEVFQYSNLMTAAAGYIAAAALEPAMEWGQGYDAAMRRKLFEPLGMRRSTFDFAQASAGNHAAPHGDALDGSTRRLGLGWTASVIPFRPAGGVWTSARDLSQWVLMELGRGRGADGARVISEANWAERYKPQIAISTGVHYGMGLIVDQSTGVTVVSHGGAISGYRSNMVWLPEHGIGATILTNADAGEALLGPLQRKLLEMLFDGEPQADAQLRLAVAGRNAEADRTRASLTLPNAAEDMEKLAREYVNPALGTLKVEASHGDLLFRFANGSSQVALRRNEDGSLSYVTTDPGLVGIEFLRDDRTAPATLVLREAQHEYRFVPRRPALDTR